VCGISCGGIHNAVYTESGQVYTWGCADDGSLGRIGEESVPLLVDVSDRIVVVDARVVMMMTAWVLVEV